MHRSGTSLVTRLLSLSGMRLPEDLLPPNEFNECGYWESNQARLINDRLLTALNSAWFDALPLHWEGLPDRADHVSAIRDFLSENLEGHDDPLALKDPRMCRTMPLWLEAARSLGLAIAVIIPFRNPLEVAESLKRRDQVKSGPALDLWMRHVLDAEAHSRGERRIILPYAGLLGESTKGLERLSLFAGRTTAGQANDEAMQSFIQSGQRHHVHTLDELQEKQGKRSAPARLMKALNESAYHDGLAQQAEFDHLRLALDEAQRAGQPETPPYIEKHFRPKAHKPRTPEAITQVSEERMTLRQDVISSSRKVENLNASVARHKSLLQSSRQELEEARSEQERLRSNISQLDDDLDAARTELQRATDSARHMLRNRDTWLTKAIARRKALEQDHQRLLKQMRQARRDIGHLREMRKQWVSEKASSAAGRMQLAHQITTRDALDRSPAWHFRRLLSTARAATSARLFTDRRLRLMQETGTFDPEWYLFRNPDLAGTDDLALHFLVNGGFEGRSPSAYFDTGWYLENHPDVAASDINPLLHYLTVGHREGREPHPLFSSTWYAQRHPECGGAGLPALQHFISEGDAAGHAPSSLFDSAAYLQAHPDVRASGMPPFYHYVSYGRDEGRQDRILVTTPEPWEELNLRHHEGFNAVRRSASADRRRNKRKNLLLVAHTAGKRLFGAERSFLDVCRAVDTNRFNVIVVLPRAQVEYIRAVCPHADHVYNLKFGWWLKGQDVQEPVIQTFRHLIREHDIDLVYGNTIMTREPFLAARAEGVPSLLHAREIISADSHLVEVIGEDEEHIRKQVMERADYLVVNSLATAREFDEKREQFLVYNAIDADDFVALENEVGEAIYIGIISSNLAKKGLGDFLRLADAARERLPCLVFRVIGPETDDLTELMDQLFGGVVPGNVEICGYANSAAEAISRVNLLVNFSSFAESFGRTIAEAMAAGRPAIVYDHGALPELVEHEQTGIVIPFGDYEAALPYLERFCSAPELMMQMGEAARQRACAWFDLPVLGKAINRAFSLAIAGAVDDAALAEPAEFDTVRPLRIAYFQWHFPVPSETFVLNELRYLLEQGHDVIVYCKQSPHKDFTPDFDIHWERVASPEELAEKLRETNRERAHAHFVYPTVTDFLWPACEMAGIPFTFIAHAQDIFRYGNDAQNRIGEIAQSELCRRVLVPGQFHRRYLLERDVPAEKILVNPQGIDARLYRFDGGEDKPEYRVISCVQRFVEKKGISDLIAAAPALKAAGITVRIYGYGPMQEAYERQIAALQADNVELCGPVTSRAELIDVISHSDLFVTPCTRAEDGDMDGIPTVFMEAMATGTPVLTSGVSSIPDLVADGLNGLICRERDPVSLAEKVLEFYAMPPARRLAMRLAARRRVEQEYDTRKLLGRLLDLYRERTVDIVIVAWNNLPQLREVVRRIMTWTGMPYRLIINDNGSDADVIEFLERLAREHEQVTVLFQGENLYVGPGTNRAVEAGRSEYIIYVCGKEGFALQSNWERELVEYLDAHPEAGLAGTLGYSPSYLTGRTYPAIPAFGKFRNPQFAEENPDRLFRHIQGGLFAIRRSMFEEIGGFSDDVPHDHTDVEYSYYVESQGWELGQVPGMLALYNKTRPGIFSRLDEQVRVIHPPTLPELETVAKVVEGRAALCNLCGWLGDAFTEQEGQSLCPECGSRPSHRSAWRYLAESTLTHRRLLGLYVNPGEPLAATWEQQFRGPRLDAADLHGLLVEGEGLSLKDGCVDIALLDEAIEAPGDALLAEVRRVISDEGLLFVRQPFGPGERFARLDEVINALEQAGLSVHDQVRFESRAVRFDWLPLLVCRSAS